MKLTPSELHHIRDVFERSIAISRAAATRSPVGRQPGTVTLLERLDATMKAFDNETLTVHDVAFIVQELESNSHVLALSPEFADEAALSQSISDKLRKKLNPRVKI